MRLRAKTFEGFELRFPLLRLNILRRIN